MALPIPVQKEQSPSVQDPGAPCPSLWMQDMDIDQEPKAEAELLWNNVSLQNLWVLLVGLCV